MEDKLSPLCISVNIKLKPTNAEKFLFEVSSFYCYTLDGSSYITTHFIFFKNYQKVTGRYLGRFVHPEYCAQFD